MDRLGHKLVALATIFLTIFIMTALPIKVAELFYKQGRKGVIILSVIMCFGGGIFFGAYLLHMTPEVVEKIDLTITGPHHVHYPVAYILIGAGFFLMMFMEKAVVELQKWKDKKRTGKEALTTASKANTLDVMVVSMKKIDSGNTTAAENSAFTKSEENMANGIGNPVGSGHDHAENHVHSHGTPHHEDEHLEIRDIDHYDHHEHGQEVGHSHAQGSAAKSIVLLLALSVDCVFEGLSLGLQQSVIGVWNMVLAILSHEIVVAFSLGLQLFKHNSARKTLLMALIYGLTCPVGIAIGTGIMEGAGQNMNIDLLYGVLLALTAGVFIYVTFFEILVHEISHDATLMNLLAVLIGFCVMASLMVVHNKTHVHGHDNQTDHVHGHHGYAIAQWVDSLFETNGNN